MYYESQVARFYAWWQGTMWTGGKCDNGGNVLHDTGGTVMLWHWWKYTASVHGTGGKAQCGTSGGKQDPNIQQCLFFTYAYIICCCFWLCVCVCVCVCACVRASVHACMCMCACACVCARMCACVCVRVHVHIVRTCMYVCVHGMCATDLSNILLSFQFYIKGPAIALNKYSSIWK